MGYDTLAYLHVVGKKKGVSWFPEALYWGVWQLGPWTSTTEVVDCQRILIYPFPCTITNVPLFLVRALKLSYRYGDTFEVAQGLSIYLVEEVACLLKSATTQAHNPPTFSVYEYLAGVSGGNEGLYLLRVLDILTRKVLHVTHWGWWRELF